MSIRPYREPDEEAVLALWEAAGINRPWLDLRAEIAEKLRRDRELFLVAEEDDDSQDAQDRLDAQDALRRPPAPPSRAGKPLARAPLALRVGLRRQCRERSSRRESRSLGGAGGLGHPSRIVGAVMGAYDGRRGWVYHLAVAPDRRRQGIGRRLMAALEQAMIDAGVSKVNLQVRADNVGVVGFYERLGYLDERLTSMARRLRP